MNLLANAFKLVPTGGRVQCSVQEARDQLIIAVDDSGPGVSAELRQAVFERFRQGNGGSNRKAGGTGLGLAVAKEFVEMHKGYVDVLDSDLGGARFQITLPFHRGSPGTAPDIAVTESDVNRTTLAGLIEELRQGDLSHTTEAVEVAGVTGMPRILVVEDNSDMNRFITQCLARDYELMSALDGRAGLEKAVQFQPALIVSDIMMPNVSGTEMIAEMRTMPELRDTPVILLSAKADEQLMVELLGRGARDFIVKPFSENDLRVRVRNLILAQQASQESAQSLTREQEEAGNSCERSSVSAVASLSS